MKKISSLFIVILILLTPFSAKSQDIDSITAKSVAKNFYQTLQKETTRGLQASIAYQSEIISSQKGSSVGFYIINLSDEGFVIVSGDQKVQPILGFSTEGVFHSEDIPENLQFLLQEYDKEIQAIIESPSTDSHCFDQKWASLTQAKNMATGTVVVGPLVTSKWTQGKYYNNHCPVDASAPAAAGGHALVGCGAIVMGQVMRYWRYPITGSGTHSYNSGSYGTLSADFGNTTYDYDNMPVRLLNSSTNEQVEAVSTLLYHCGVAVNMNYGPSASWSNSNNIVAAMSNYFGYPATVEYIERSSTNATTWLELIKGELDDFAPFFYGGTGSQGGHVFVCDGYRDDDFVHINWGLGSYDGYFAVTALNPGPYNFSSSQAIIIGIRGPEPPVSITDNKTGNITIYPNPTSDLLRIETTGKLNGANLSLYDINGRLLLSDKINMDGQNSYFIHLKHLSKGMYFLSIDNENNHFWEKVIVE